MPKYIDIHTHLNFTDYGPDRFEVIKRALDHNVWLINVGADMESSREAVRMLNHFPAGVFAAVGLHPTEGGLITEAEWSELSDLAQHDKVVAIGECGLEKPRDRVWDRSAQEDIFRRHIELATKLNKPLMIHCRDAYSEVYEIMKETGARGNMHFFAGNLDDMKKFTELGCSLSFTGVITFANQYDEVVRTMPEPLIMAETDAPWVAPLPYRGKRNEPLFVAEVVAKMASLRGIDPTQMAQITVENARRLFKLGND